MKKSIQGFGLLIAGIVLVGCSGSGVTYGTGVTHEKQTLTGLSKVFNLKPDEGEKIDYAARPDLVLPSNKQALPAPAETVEADENWPVTPDQRIAAIRANADAQKDSRGNFSHAFNTDTNKQGIKKTTRRSSGEDVTDVLSSPTAKTLSQLNGEGNEAKKRRDQLAYSTGAQRKYLTEPPKIYRTPSDNAAAGVTGLNEETLDEKVKKRERDEKLLGISER